MAWNDGEMGMKGNAPRAMQRNVLHKTGARLPTRLDGMHPEREKRKKKKKIKRESEKGILHRNTAVICGSADTNLRIFFAIPLYR